MTERYFCSPQQQPVGVPAEALLSSSCHLSFQFTFHFFLHPSLPPTSPLLYFMFPLFCLLFYPHPSSLHPPLLPLDTDAHFGSFSFFRSPSSSDDDYTVRKLRYKNHKRSTKNPLSFLLFPSLCPLVSSQWIPADFNLSRL